MLRIPPAPIAIVKWKVAAFCLLLLFGVAGLMGGSWWLWHDSTRVCITEDTESLGAVATGSAHLVTSAVPQIFIDIAGAVQKPGLYQVDTNSRLATLIEKVGGFTKTADTQYISQELNLAQRLNDGDKIYIYTKQEASKRRAESLPAANSTNPQSSSSQSDGLVSLNTATQKELEALPGIGEKRAADIIAHRPYSSLNELLTKKLVTEAIFNDIQSKLKI